MKPLLRAVLILDAGLYLSSGAVLLLTPLAGVQRALQLTAIEPAMVGQMLGLALLGLAWLSLRGAVDGAMTIAVAKIVGHVTWLAGALVLVWTLAPPHTLWFPALGIVPNLLVGGLLVVIGLGGVRFAQAVRRREIAKAAQAAAKGRVAADVPAAAPSVPVEPVFRPAPSAVPPVAPSGPASTAERDAALRSEASARDAAASAGAASGSDDVRSSRSTSAPRPPFHG
ncbi:hypothetical protein [Trinickia sp. Y13]|uniref:hypothetical protein n=1 Tax=Trinickia sp. Y13 TaxID=2917807 RepID=UPI0024071182|nr:hypothetical protein [Trinickia sp. Y13]MDG0024126.1 hypothetical protein [Trinickia sp. Y13]